MKRLLVALLVAAPIAAIGAQSLDELYRATLEQDRVRTQRVIELTQAREKLAVLTDFSPFSFSLSSGQGRLIFPSGDDSASLNLEPQASLDFAEPWETQATLGIATSLDFGALSLDGIRPSLSITQPLAGFIWGRKPDTNRASLEKAVVDAEDSLASRETALRLSLLEAIRAVKKAQSELAAKEYSRQTAAKALDKARASGSYGEKSAALAKLRLDLAAADSELAAGKRGLETAFASLERLAGSRPAAIPVPEAPETVLVPPADAAGATLEVIAARRRYELLVFTDKAERGFTDRSLDLSFAAGKASSDFTSGTWDYSARVAFAQDAFSASAGAGVLTRGSGSSSIQRPYLSILVGWKPEDRKKTSHEDAATDAELAAAAISIQAAEKAVRETLAGYAEDAALLADSKALLPLRAAYAELLIAEKEKARAAGLIDDAELAAARWERDKLAYENDIARCDRAILAERIAALFPRKVKP